MSVSQLSLAKSETRELAEKDYRHLCASRLGEPTDWKMNDNLFFLGFVAIATVLAVLALVLR